MLGVMMVYVCGAIALVASIPQNNVRLLKYITYIISAFACYCIWSVVDMFEESNGYFQMLITIPWIKKLGIHLTFALDGYALWSVILTLIVTNIAAILVCEWKSKGLKNQLLIVYILQAMLFWCFSTLDALVFFILFEAMLLPMYAYIVIWGGEERIEAGWIFLVYTLSGSVGMLIALTYMGVIHNSFAWQSWADAPLSLQVQSYYFIALSLAMATKLPIFPLHGWLPKVHTQASTSASMILAGLFLKVAAFGYIRWILPIVPDASRLYAPYMVVLAVGSMMGMMLVAWAQEDIKRVIAYASIQHMAWIILAFFIGYLGSGDSMMYGLLDGAIMQIFAHGLVSAGLFMAFGMMYQRTHQRDRKAYGGFARIMPLLSGWFMVLALANTAIPGSLNFVAEWTMLVGIFHVEPWVGVISALSFLLSCTYTLGLYNDIFYGPVTTQHVHKDISTTEGSLLVILVAIILVLGFFPRPVLESIHATSMVMGPYIYRSKLG